MNWLYVADWCERHVCFEAQRCGSCGCKQAKGACYTGRTCKAICEALDVGNGNTDDMTTVYNFVRRKSCHTSRKGEECSHRGCAMSEQIQAFITQEMMKRKAA